VAAHQAISVRRFAALSKTAPHHPLIFMPPVCGSQAWLTTGLSTRQYTTLAGRDADGWPRRIVTDPVQCQGRAKSSPPAPIEKCPTLVSVSAGFSRSEP
jgi:hypothetical protein